LTIVVVYLAAGAVTGFLSGIFGIGGGLIVVPVLLFAFALQGVADEVAIHMAIASSMTTIVVTALSSIRAHWRRGNVLWPVFRVLGIGMLIGAFVGAQITGRLPADVLSTVFAAFMLIMAARMFLSRTPKGEPRQCGHWSTGWVGVVIGALSSVVGIGGGSMTVPYLAWRGIPMRQAVGTSAACGLPIAIAGTLGYIVAGASRDLPLPPLSTGFIHWPSVAGITATSVLLAPVGAHVASRVPHAYLRRGFAVLLLVVSLNLLFG
jgi:uncharacterized membrane protein YfcA